MNSKLIISATLMVALVVASFAYWFVEVQNRHKAADDITSFDECVQAGNPVQESYPGVCTTQSGKSFTQSNVVQPGQSITREQAIELINKCEVTGTYALHNGESGLILKNDKFQKVAGASVKELRQNENPRCPFTQTAIE